MRQTRVLGKNGEIAAATYLQTKGWKILAHNYRLGHKEIDLIAQKNKKLCLFEIKTRTAIKDEQIITSKQCNTLRQAHQEFCYKHNLKADSVEYHLILISVFNRQAHLKEYSDFLS